MASIRCERDRNALNNTNLVTPTTSSGNRTLSHERGRGPQHPPAQRGRNLYNSAIETRTFLYTDIEGSTALLRRLGGDSYAQVLADHHAIIRDGLTRHSGKEEGTQGDSFFATFTSSSACVAAAIEMQRELAGHGWPDGVRLRVRMGVHTGEASETSTGLVGYEVHRAARIGSVAHGGQVLLSSATAGLVEESLAGEVELRNLGPHQLKDLGRPETLFQLVAPGLDAEFPPLRTLDNPDLPNNLPTSLSPFVGRVDELSEVRRLIKESRLVTLTGAGGSGKTRLALQAAAELLDGSGEGVWFVELAPVTDPENVPVTVIDALRIRVETSRTPFDELLHALREQTVLVVLDNCEHVIDVVAKLVDSIVRNCPKVRLVATSREPLGVDGEQVYRVRSLSLPDRDVETKEDLDGSDSVGLFLVRARLHDSQFSIDDASAPYVASICRRLDGIPLAIELAAARLASMSLQDLSRRLDQRFRLLTGGSRSALPRQQTLGAMVAWSYDLLNEPEREVLRRLSVFANGFDLDAAESICASEHVDSFDVPGILGSLVNKNLVQAERSSEAVRYRLLETIRQYAAEQLLQVDGELSALALRKSHADHFLAKYEAAASSLRRGATKVQLLRQVDDDWDDILAAFETMVEDPGDSQRVLRLGSALGPYLQARYQHGPVGLMMSALQGYVQRDGIRAWCLYWVPVLRPDAVAEDVRDEQLRRDLAMETEAVALAREIDDQELCSLALGWQAELTSRLGDRELALEQVESSLTVAREANDARLIAVALFHKGIIQSFHGVSRSGGIPSLEGAAAFEESIAWFRRAPDPVGLCRALHVSSLVRSTDADLHRQREIREEALRVAEEVGDAIFVIYGTSDLSHIVFMEGEIDLAEAHARRSLMLARRLGLPGWESTFTFNNLACCAAAAADFERAARLLGGVDGLDRLVPEHSGFRWSDSESRARRDAETAACEALGEERFKSLVEEGRAMSYDELVNLALRRTPSPS